MKCPKCNNEVSHLSGTCPNCGYAFPEEQEKPVTANIVQEDEGIEKAKDVQLAGKIFFIVGVLASVIGAIMMIVMGADDGKEFLILLGFVTLAVGIVLPWVIYTLISGFAMLIKKTSLIEQHINNKK